MFVVHLYLRIAPSGRRTALNALLDQLDAVRAMSGCLRYIPFEDPSDDEGLCILEEWESREAFAAYAGSGVFDGLGLVLRPMMLSAPVTNRFEASPVEAAN